MNASSERATFVARCLRVASVAQTKGVTLTKLEKQHVVEVSKGEKVVAFPIVTDDRLWRETTVEEAFYAVLLDARGWDEADVSDAVVIPLTDEVAVDQVSLIKRDLADEKARVGDLTEMLGGPEGLAALYATADLA